LRPLRLNGGLIIFFRIKKAGSEADGTVNFIPSMHFLQNQ
jgi:hypothetical protein